MARSYRVETSVQSLPSQLDDHKYKSAFDGLPHGIQQRGAGARDQLLVHRRRPRMLRQFQCSKESSAQRRSTLRCPYHWKGKQHQQLDMFFRRH